MYISKQFGFEGFNISFGLITFYVSIHIIAGFVFSILTIRLLKELNGINRSLENKQFSKIEDTELQKTKKSKKNKLRKKIITFGLLLIFIGLSYLIDNQKGISGYFITVFRFIAIIAVWIFFIAPFLTKILAKYLGEKHKKYHGEIEEIINSFPNIKKIGNEVWDSVKTKGVFVKYPLFIKKVIIQYLVY